MKPQKWYWWLLFFCIVLQAACKPAADRPAPTQEIEETQPPVEVTRPVSPTSIQTTSKDTIDTDTCNSHGEVKRYKLDSELMNGDQFVSIYFPPCYDENLAGGYPVLYLLHGQTFDDNMWLDLGAGEAADELILSAVVKPFLMVFPYEEFYYRKADETKFPQAFFEEIIPFVEDSFNICTGRACRALGGISRGASWSVRLGFQHWDLFSSIGAHSLPTFRGDLNDLPGWLAGIPDEDVPRIYLDTGRFDPEVKTAYAFEQVLNEKGILHEWHLNDGRHNNDYWMEHMGEFINWYASGWDTLE